MGHKRHSEFLSADAPDLAQSLRGKTDLRLAAIVSDKTSRCAETACSETNVWREARRFRDEWRQHRYSRLRAA